MEELTCDDVILRQRLRLFLFPLAFHDTQFSPSEKKKKKMLFEVLHKKRGQGHVLDNVFEEILTDTEFADVKIY